MIGVIAISGTQQTAFAENKAKEYCSDYGGEWDNGEGKIKMMKIKQIMRMMYAMMPKIIKNIKKYVTLE